MRDKMVPNALIDALVVAAEDVDVAQLGKLVGVFLVKAFAVRRSVDDGVVGTFGLQRFNTVKKRFGPKHHTRITAKRVIVHLFVLAHAKGLQIVQMHLDEAFLLRAL